ncbi:MAG: hypothetical protein A2406_04170 [Candidatus Komeilibacteria bacterium RIFOXYC1_FULL_37_11]|uniref:HAD family hydrolase n=1 Tax=Candidatus Komeilibacteria bacterium RIFOXYC1_FULL_37_11 TaxID=1798555 RepID=A0A1G2BX23_9BACT|nr:MAG: hypothetical protein A2406_04170 [Candidatus Komeilibacteria bacterium RIFOXYC1_FULL_37_11]OGY95823.1 MAG: hypothetical protein A2611_03550 [Candidatus Komeilibacteria bacterium RIFOXYD1_FULL_37_29]
MKNKIVFFDVDNTIVDGYTQKYFIHYLFKEKYINSTTLFLSYIWFFLYKLGIVKDVSRAVNFYIKFVRGFSRDKLNNIIKTFFDVYIKNIIYKEFKQLIEKYKIEGAKVVLVSTSLEPIVKAIADYLDVNDYIATKLKLENSLYTGLVEGSVVTGDKKLELVKHLLSTYEHTNIETYFYSDHLSDIDLLNFVDNPYVVNPSKILYNKAVRKNWGIINIK